MHVKGTLSKVYIRGACGNGGQLVTVFYQGMEYNRSTTLFKVLIKARNNVPEG